MTKLEQKLIELGYKDYGIPPYLHHNHMYKKFCEYPTEIRIYLMENKKSIMNYVIHIDDYSFKEQEVIDNLQQVFNQLKKDLEVLKDE